MQEYSLIVIGGGPAGMAAAISAQQQGIKDILIIERCEQLGGVLNQCIHSGFGIHRFKEELTGSEYSYRVIQEILKNGLAYVTNTTVLKIVPEQETHVVHTLSSQGYKKLRTKTLVLAMGCRERTRGAIMLHGSRPAGVYSAGTVQQMINLEGILPGKRAVILGSGDIGLIMARRMVQEGAKVEAVLEIMSHSNGLTRNIVQCLQDFNIPLLLKTTITRVHGKERVEGVSIAEVDDKFKPIVGTERFLECDTVLLAVGLIPENELSRKARVAIDERTQGPIVGELRQTSVAGIFACGNVLQVHDLVDFVSAEGELAGQGAALYVQKKIVVGTTHTIVAAEGVSYVVPQHININNITNKVRLFLRVKNIVSCGIIKVSLGGKDIVSKQEPRLVPAEMVSIDLKKADLLAEDATDIVVRIEAKT